MHLAGPGDDFRKWNNTGVWKNVAVAAGPVHIPADWEPVAEGRCWNVYQRGDYCISVYSQTEFGMVYVSREVDPSAALKDVETVNADERALNHSFQVPGGELVEYDLTAPKNRWVITKIDGQPVRRKFDRWPRMVVE